MQSQFCYARLTNAKKKRLNITCKTNILINDSLSIYLFYLFRRFMDILYVNVKRYYYYIIY